MNDRPYKMNLRLICSDSQNTRMLYDLLLPEIKTFSPKRAKIVFNIENKHQQILFAIEATDVTALRSTINSILRLIILIENIFEMLK